MYVNDRGQKVFVGQEAITGFLTGLRKLREARKLHYKTTFQDLPVSIENRKGSIRRGTDPDGKEWETKHKRPYGYIPGTKGPDGDSVDVFLGPNEDAAFAYVIHINNPETGKYDEDKVMLGFDDEDAALRCFRQHYDDPKKFYSGMDVIPMWKFREKVFVKKETSKKLVASTQGWRSDKPSILPYDKGQQIVAPVAMVARFYPDVLGSLETHEKIEAFPDIESPDTIPTPLKKKRSKEVEGASLQVPEEYFEAGTGTDRDMKRAILGHHQDIMIDPKVREGGPGSGPQEHIEKAGGKYLGSMEHPSGGRIHGFSDPETGSTMWMKDTDIKDPQSVKDHMSASRKKFKSKESQEHGVKGMKWGIRHVRKDAAPKQGSLHQKTGNSIHKRDLADDPKTMNMMRYTAPLQKTLDQHNSKNQQQAQQGKPVDPKSAHNAVLSKMLGELGWKAAGAIARVAGVGAEFDAVKSIVQSPSGQKFALNTDKQGNHSLTADKQGKNPIGAKAQHAVKRTKAPIRAGGPGSGPSTSSEPVTQHNFPSRAEDDVEKKYEYLGKKKPGKIDFLGGKDLPLGIEAREGGPGSGPQGKKGPILTEKNMRRPTPHPKETYHGTTFSNAKKIMKSGLHSGLDSNYGSSKKDTAKHFAWTNDNKGFAIVVFKPGTPWIHSERDDYVQSRSKIPAKYVSGVEIYNKDGKLVKTVKKRARESRSFDDRLNSFLREAKKKIYYARSLQHYGSNRESDDLDFLEEEYSGMGIKYPRTRRHSELGMGYFHKKIDKAKEVVISPFRKGHVTAGVASEANHALKNGIPVRMLRHGKLRTVKRLDIREGGRPGGMYAKVILERRKRK